MSAGSKEGTDVTQDMLAQAVRDVLQESAYRPAVNTLVDTLGITRHAAARLVVVAILNNYPMGGRA